MILVCEILRKFDIDSLYICPPYLYTVKTLPWKIQKSHFSTVLLIETECRSKPLPSANSILYQRDSYCTKRYHFREKKL